MTKISQLSSIGDSLAIGDQFLIRDIDDTGSPNKSVTVSGITRALDLGTAAAPAIAFATDKNTGIFSPGADQVAISTNGTGRLSISSAGEVTTTNEKLNLITVGRGAGAISSNTAVGTSALASNTTGNFNTANGLHALLSSTTGANNTCYGFEAGKNLTNGSNNTIIGNILGTAGLANTVIIGAGATERLRINSSGNVGIGTSSPGTKLEVNGDILSPGRGTSFGYKLPDCRVFNPSSGGIFAIDDYINTRFFINSSGNVGIGTTSPVALLQVGVGNPTVSNAKSIFNTGDTANAGVLVSNWTGSATTNGPRISFDNSLRGVFEIGGGNGVGSFVVRDAQAASDRFTIDSSGRLLVGTSTARTNIDHALGNTGSQLQIEQANATTNFSVVQNFDSATTGAPAIFTLARSGATSLGSTTIVANGNRVGEINFSGSDGTDFTVAACIRGEVDGTPGANDMPGRLVFSTTADGAASPTERMRIDSSGDVAIGTTTTSLARLTIEKAFSGGTAIDTNTTTASTAYTGAAFRHNGTLSGSITVSTTATSYNTSSDYRLKENVTAVTDGITRLQQLNPSRFNFIVDPDHTVDGFLAHEAQVVVPECVTGAKDEVDDDGNPVYQGIDQSKLVPLLTAALQEAIGRIETLEAEVALLKGE